MTNAQAFAACVALASDFRVGVEYPIVGRSLVWRAHLGGNVALPELSAGVLFPDGSEFEPKFTVLLQNAALLLRTATG